MDVEIAAVQLAREALFAGPPAVETSLDPMVSWSNRPTVVVDVPDNALVVDVLDAGATKLGLKVRSSEIWSSETRPSEALSGLYFGAGDGEGVVELEAILNDDGSAQWWFDPSTVTIADVVAAREAGLLMGDPSRLLVLVDEPPPGVGNGLDFWFEVLRVLPELQQFAKAAADAVGPWATLGGATIGAWKVIKSVWRRWDTTGGDLARYQQLFRLARTTSQVAALLKIEEDDVAPLLQFLGMDQHRDGYWRRSNEPDRQQFAELAQVADTAAHMHLSAGALSKGLQEVLALPPGGRSKVAEGIFRRMTRKELEAPAGSEEDPFVTRSESGREDEFDVVDFGEADSVVLGIIRAEDDGAFYVRDPRGRLRVDSVGHDVQFPTLDEAARYIRQHAHRN